MYNRKERKQFNIGIFGVAFLGYAPGFIKGIIEQDLAIPQEGGPENWSHIYGFPAILISTFCLFFCALALKAVYQKSLSLIGWEAKLGINLAFVSYFIGCLLQFSGNSFFPIFICMGISMVFVVVLMS